MRIHLDELDSFDLVHDDVEFKIRFSIGKLIITASLYGEPVKIKVNQIKKNVILIE